VTPFRILLAALLIAGAVECSRSALAQPAPTPAPAPAPAPAAAAPAIPDSSRTGRMLTLREAIALAARDNPALAAAGAELRIAEAGIESARGLDDQLLEVAGSWVDQRRELVMDRPGVQEPAVDRLTGSLGIFQPLPTGGRLGLELSNEYSRTRFSTLVESMQMTGDPTLRRSSTNEVFAPALQLTLQHSLLRGFGVGVARADRRRARAARDQAGAQREAVAASLLRDVTSAYWDLAYATQELQIRQQSAAGAREQLARVMANIEVGKQPRSASAEIEVSIALRDESVLLARQVLVDRALELSRLCGLPIEAVDHQSLRAADLPQGDARAPDRRVALAAALEGYPQIQALRAQGRAASVEVEVTDNGLLPQLDFSVGGGPIGTGADPGGAFRQMRRFDTYVITAGLVFSQPLGRHAARGAHTAARETLHKVRLTEADLTRQVTSAVVRTVTAVDTASQRVQVLARSTDAAALDLEGERARFEVGRATNFDVLRRQEALAVAQLVHLRARVDLLKSRAALDALTGEILERHGVTLR
jgi:outer membrane protein TolC